MRSRLAYPVLLFWLLTYSSLFTVAQSTPTTGVPPLSSTAGGPFDIINLANLNIHFSIPVFSRPGKGMPFSYSLNYDSLVWQVIKNSGGQLQWAPMSNWGWSGSTQPATGYVTYNYSDTVVRCGSNNVEKETWSNFVYYDSFGTPHAFGSGTGSSLWIYDDNGCGNSKTTMTVGVPENSGYQIQVGPVYTGEQNVPTTVTAAGGIKISPPSLSSSGSGTVQDINGNLITATSSGGATITDTLNTVALTISGSAPNNPPTCGPDLTYTYTAPNNQQGSIRVNYLYYVAQTNFQVPSIQEYGTYGICLVNRVTLPDGTYYQLGYETTVGLSGKTTGRISSITLPTGGTITYSYGSGVNSMMADGSPSTMSRSLDGGTWQYSRTIRDQQNTQQTWTVITSPVGDITDIFFSGMYQTARSVYAGARVANLDYSYICYDGNNNLQSCATAIVNSTQYVNETKAYDFPSAVPPYSIHDATYDQYGNLTGDTIYDFSSPSTPLRVVTNSYNTCTSNNICNELASNLVKDGGNHWVAQTDYGYDGNGNVNSVKRYSSSGSSLLQQYSYNPGGTLNTATDPNGAVATYGYAGTSCNNAFPTSVTLPAWPSIQYAYNCAGGVVTSVTDANGAVTSTNYSDPYFWRPASSTDALNNTTTYSYISPTQFESTMNFNNGSSTQDKLVLLDGFGRTLLHQTRQAPGSNNFDTIEWAYDSSGRVAIYVAPFTSPAWSGIISGPTYNMTNYYYDALGRATSVVNSGGDTTSYSYNLNDVTVTLTPAPNGEHAKSRQLEQDALGRVTSVCEILASGGGSCGQNTSASGYRSGYGYDTNGNLVSVAQASQSRAFTYDGLSRMTSELNPETSSTGGGGTTYYTYDSDGTCGTYTGDKVKRLDPAGNVTCYRWDGLHRIRGITYPSGPNSGNNLPKTFYWDAGSVYGMTMNNPVGHLTAALTGNNTVNAAFSYDKRGQITDSYTLSPNSAGWYHVQETSYFANGLPVSLQGFTGTGTSTPFSNLLTYNLDGEGRVYGMVDNYYGTLWNLTNYNAASQPTSVIFVGGGESFQYDPYSNRMTQWQSITGSNVQTGTLTWNANRTLQKLAITDTANSANSQTCAYGYDDLARLSGVNCGPIWSQAFSYDQWSNINKSGSVSFSSQGGAGNHAPGLSYDADGNVTNDGGHTYAYDVEGRPVSIDNNAIQVAYDAFGREAEIKSGGTWTQIVYDGQGRKFGYMNGQALNRYIMPMVAGITAVNRGPTSGYFQHVDWLGSSRFSTFESTMVYDRAYAPFGETYAESFETTTNRNFTGQTQDVAPGATGNYDFLFRQYSSSQGRWLVPDPAGLAAVDITNPQTWNRYAYVNNQPLSLIDNIGAWPTDVHHDILRIAGGLAGLSQQQVDTLINASDSVDGVLNGGQSAALSNNHSMCQPGQSLEQCKAGIANNISSELSQAQALGPIMGLWALGVALHAITDSTSPWHTDAAMGNPLCWGCSLKDDKNHVIQEHSEAWNHPQQIQQAITLAQQAIVGVTAIWGRGGGGGGPDRGAFFGGGFTGLPDGGFAVGAAWGCHSDGEGHTVCKWQWVK